MVIPLKRSLSDAGQEPGPYLPRRPPFLSQGDMTSERHIETTDNASTLPPQDLSGPSPVQRASTASPPRAGVDPSPRHTLRPNTAPGAEAASEQTASQEGTIAAPPSDHASTSQQRARPFKTQAETIAGKNDGASNTIPHTVQRHHSHTHENPVTVGSGSPTSAQPTSRTLLSPTSNDAGSPNVGPSPEDASEDAKAFSLMIKVIRRGWPSSFSQPRPPVAPEDRPLPREHPRQLSPVEIDDEDDVDVDADEDDDDDEDEVNDGTYNYEPDRVSDEPETSRQAADSLSPELPPVIAKHDDGVTQERPFPRFFEGDTISTPSRRWYSQNRCPRCKFDRPNALMRMHFKRKTWDRKNKCLTCRMKKPIYKTLEAATAAAKRKIEALPYKFPASEEEEFFAHLKTQWQSYKPNREHRRRTNLGPRRHTAAAAQPLVSSNKVSVSSQFAESDRPGNEPSVDNDSDRDFQARGSLRIPPNESPRCTRQQAALEATQSASAPMHEQRQTASPAPSIVDLVTEPVQPDQTVQNTASPAQSIGTTRTKLPSSDASWAEVRRYFDSLEEEGHQSFEERFAAVRKAAYAEMLFDATREEEKETSEKAAHDRYVRETKAAMEQQAKTCEDFRRRRQRLIEQKADYDRSVAQLNLEVSEWKKRSNEREAQQKDYEQRCNERKERQSEHAKRKARLFGLP